MFLFIWIFFFNYFSVISVCHSLFLFQSFLYSYQLISLSLIIIYSFSLSYVISFSSFLSFIVYVSFFYLLALIFYVFRLSQSFLQNRLIFLAMCVVTFLFHSSNSFFFCKHSCISCINGILLFSRFQLSIFLSKVFTFLCRYFLFVCFSIIWTLIFSLTIIKFYWNSIMYILFLAF